MSLRGLVDGLRVKHAVVHVARHQPQQYLAELLGRKAQQDIGVWDLGEQGSHIKCSIAEPLGFGAICRGASACGVRSAAPGALPQTCPQKLWTPRTRKRPALPGGRLTAKGVGRKLRGQQAECTGGEAARANRLQEAALGH